MEINLKQPELFKAIRQYLESQGFQTRGKEITINVSGGRGNTGAWAAIAIEEIDIPGFEANSDDAPIIEMMNQEINALALEHPMTSACDVVTDVSPSPAPADAAPAPVYETREPVDMVDAVVGIDMAAEPSLETSDADLFQMPTEHQPEEDKPAPATPSSLFDE